MIRRGIGRAGGPGLLATAARTAVIAGTAQAVTGRVAERQHDRAVAKAQAANPQQAASQQAPPPAPAPAPAPAAPAAAAPAAGLPTDDDLALLEKLGALHAQGILTDEEFAAKKAQILGL